MEAGRRDLLASRAMAQKQNNPGAVLTHFSAVPGKQENLSIRIDHMRETWQERNIFGFHDPTKEVWSGATGQLHERDLEALLREIIGRTCRLVSRSLTHLVDTGRAPTPRKQASFFFVLGAVAGIAVWSLLQFIAGY